MLEHARKLVWASAVTVLSSAGWAVAHPHVWVDGGVDFVVESGTVLNSLRVTWLFDDFETLFMIAGAGMALNEAGKLIEVDRVELARQLSDWPDDFGGSVHLSVNGAVIPLAWPEGVEVDIVDGRLQVTFLRRLESPLDLNKREVEVEFYESTYFFDFSVTNTPLIEGGAAGICATEVIPFDPNSILESIQVTLLELGREETPSIPNVGALFADRIVMKCD